MNLEKIKKMLKSKKGIVVSGVIVGAVVVGIIGGVLVNGANKSNDIAENNKPVISNKKEDIKKDKDESKLSEKENDKSEDRKEEEVKENESNINTPENSTSSNDVNKNTTNKNNNQSISNNSTTSSNTSSNTGNNNNTSNGSTHTHSWNPITEQVYHDEVGHYEDVVITSAWTEEIPVYEEQYRAICNTCGADITGSEASHVRDHMLNGENGSYRNEPTKVQVGTNKVNHPAVTEKKWVIDKAAWNETVTTGYRCSCGATK